MQNNKPTLKLLFVALVALLICLTCKAQVAQRVKQGAIVPFDGVVVREDKVKELYKAEQKVLVLEDLRIHEKELSDRYKVHNKDLSKKLSNSKMNAFWSKVGFFVLGAVVYRGVTK